MPIQCSHRRSTGLLSHQVPTGSAVQWDRSSLKDLQKVSHELLSFLVIKATDWSRSRSAAYFLHSFPLAARCGGHTICKKRSTSLHGNLSCWLAGCVMRSARAVAVNACAENDAKSDTYAGLLLHRCLTVRELNVQGAGASCCHHSPCFHHSPAAHSQLKFVLECSCRLYTKWAIVG
jgi:hypothetical protein